MHCFGCGKSMPYTETGDPFCTKECKADYEKTTGRKRKVLMISLAVPLAVVILLILAQALHFIK
jgi:predicted nucleic acid-binding Zn ribbon protein